MQPALTFDSETPLILGQRPTLASPRKGGGLALMARFHKMGTSEIHLIFKCFQKQDQFFLLCQGQTEIPEFTGVDCIRDLGSGPAVDADRLAG